MSIGTTHREVTPVSRHAYRPRAIADLPRSLHHMTREHLTEALQREDRNGVYTDSACEEEGYPPMTESDVVDHILYGDRSGELLGWLVEHYGATVA